MGPRWRSSRSRPSSPPSRPSARCRSEFMTERQPPGYGEAASGDHLQTTYRFWLVGHQLERGDGALGRSRTASSRSSSRRSSSAAGRTGFPFWPLDALWGPVVAWNLLLLLVTFAAGLFAYLWLRELDLPPARGRARRPRVRAGSLPAPAERRAPARLGRRPPPARALGLRALPPGGDAPAPPTCGARSPPRASSRSRSRASSTSALGALPFLAAYAARPLLAHRLALGLGRSAGRRRRRAPGGGGRDRRLDGVRGEDARRGRLLLGEPARLPQPLAAARAGALRLPRLAAAGAGRRRPRRCWHAAAAGWRSCSASPRWCRRCSRSGRTCRSTRRSATSSRRFATRACPGASCRWRTWRWRRWPRSQRAAVVARFEGRRRTAVGAALLALVAADLLVFPLRSSEADRDNVAYAALADAGPGRVLELPIFQRGKGQFGSVYDYYTQQAPRERPTGYALAPEGSFEFTERFNRLDCGAWLQEDRAELERLGIRSIVWHGGLYRQSETPGAWFGWEGLRRGGIGVAAGAPPVFLWARGTRRRAAPGGAGPRPAVPLRRLGRRRADAATRARSGSTGRAVAELELEAPAPTTVTRLRGRPRASSRARRRAHDDPRRAPEPRAGTRSSSAGRRVSDWFARACAERAMC